MAFIKGTVFGLLGANGAGKSTIIECMLGTKAMDNGTVSILGLNSKSNRKELFQKVGVQFQEANYQENIKLSLRGMDMFIFAICMPTIVLVVLGIIYGNKPAFTNALYSFVSLITLFTVATAFFRALSALTPTLYLFEYSNPILSQSQSIFSL